MARSAGFVYHPRPAPRQRTLQVLSVGPGTLALAEAVVADVLSER